jgi:hypothetical protein
MTRTRTAHKKESKSGADTAKHKVNKTGSQSGGHGGSGVGRVQVDLTG